jgi:hypothetical protein
LTDDLTVAVDRLVAQVAHWSPNRWTKPASAGTGSRAETVYALAQRLADAAADASGEPRRRVPRLDNDLALPDQLRVLGADLVEASASSPELREASTADIRAVAAAL